MNSKNRLFPVLIIEFVCLTLHQACYYFLQLDLTNSDYYSTAMDILSETGWESCAVAAVADAVADVAAVAADAFVMAGMWAAK